ncbi:hypothetical protein C8Q80DRAFT_681628 [Daedaleopsis nitida]|nr:hypothetical protein C8Q80DRAFT_681628 [Daedaleopsis nitida]
MMVSAHDVVDFSAASLTDQGLPEHSGSHKLGLVDQILASHRTSNRHPAPIHKLPAEILAHIFTYVCTRLRASAESMPDYAMLVSITHICRLWRAVALGSATLWSHISLNHKSALAFAKRSQAALLTVTVSVRGKKWQKKMGLLRRLLPRIRKLHVKVTRAEDMLKLADTLSSQHITSFTLQLSTKWVNGQPVSLPPLGTIPPMFEGLSPSLRSLTIVTEDHWRIPFGHFPGLTNLRLIHDGLSIDSMSFNHLLSFLSNTPNLEDLEVPHARHGRRVCPLFGAVYARGCHGHSRGDTIQPPHPRSTSTTRGVHSSRAHLSRMGSYVASAERVPPSRAR